MHGGEVTAAAAFLLGLVGNLHCVAMCGGIALAFAGRETGRARLRRQLLLSTGRVSSYVLAGAVAGSAGWGVGEVLGTSGSLAVRVLFGVLLLAVALQLAGVSGVLTRVERFGLPVWRQVSRTVGRLRDSRSPWKAVALGAVWGWLPCGLVYGALAGALATGSAGQGALLMSCFGVGTLPALVASGTFADRLRGGARAPATRRVAAAWIAAFGLWTIVAAVWMTAGPGGGHAGH